MPMHTPRDGATFYVDPANLSALLRSDRESGKVSDELARSLCAIAGGAWDRFQFTSEREDFIQDAVMHLLKNPLRIADPARNLFSYFTTCCIRFGLYLRRRATIEQKRLNDCLIDLVLNGQVVLCCENCQRSLHFERSFHVP